jgi:hypothetical protein
MGQREKCSMSDSFLIFCDVNGMSDSRFVFNFQVREFGSIPFPSLEPCRAHLSVAHRGLNVAVSQKHPKAPSVLALVGIVKADAVPKLMGVASERHSGTFPEPCDHLPEPCRGDWCATTLRDEDMRGGGVLTL